MAKKTHSDVKDGTLLVVKDNVSRLVVTSAEPANYAGVAAVTLGDIAFTDADVTGPADEGTGRKQTYGAKNDIDVDAGGDADHVCLVDDVGERLLLATTVPAQTVTEGNTMNTAAFEHTIQEVT